MKTTKLGILVFTLVALGATAGYLEYKLLRRFGIAFTVCAIGFGSAVLLGALSIAPQGYQDGDGFHIQPLRRRVRRIPTRAAHTVA